MGIRFAAIATNKSFTPETVNELAMSLELNKLEFIKKVPFEKSSRINFRNGKKLDICFLEKGTLIFYSAPSLEKKFNLPTSSFLGKSGKFLIDEVSMSFVIDVFENLYEVLYHSDTPDEYIHKIDNTRRKDNEQIEDSTELFFLELSKIIGKSFFSIENDFECYRYSISEEGFTSKDITLPMIVRKHALHSELKKVNSSLFLD